MATATGIVPVWLPDWLVAAGTLALTAGVAALALGILRPVLRRVLRGEKTLSHVLLEKAGGFAQFALTLLATELAVPLLPLNADATDIIRRLLLAAFVILAGWVAIIASDLAINRYIGRLHVDTSDNLLARKAVTQMRILRRTANIAIGIVTVAFALMTFDAVRQFGISLFASAGVAGLAVGFAAKPLLENLVAGVQLAITQPFRIDDVVIVNDEWGWIEEINSTYVVIRIWDWRRLVVPLSYMMNNPFQNWTRTSSAIIGSVFFYVDYTADVDRIRAKVEEFTKASKLWDGKVCGVQVTDTTERTMQVRALVTAADSGKTWDLRCEVREKIIAWMRQEYPEAMPRLRGDVSAFPPLSPQAPQAGEQR